MTDIDADIVILGAGFAGSLTALLVQQLGLRPVLLERDRHPRFAIGESSTPLANLVWEQLAKRYDLPELLPFSNYASWKRTYPEIGVGLKRGFSYFQHVAGEKFAPRADHANELLVAASAGPEDADTHWLRADFDAFLVNTVQAKGIPYFDRTEVISVTPVANEWVLIARSLDSTKSQLRDLNAEIGAGAGDLRIRAKFIVDASGVGGILAKALHIPPHPAGLRTNSRAIFAHFGGVEPWEPMLAELGGRVTDHPFPCDAAALHHVFEGGWMWQLRFDSGVVSAGFTLDGHKFPRSPVGASAFEAEWNWWMKCFPSIQAQFRHATPISDGGQLRGTGRMQRRQAITSGANWVMLPGTAAFLDPLHSTGNALTLFSIERLMLALEECWGRPELAERLVNYDRILQQEVEFIDGIIAGSYRGFAQFEPMVALSMFYFASAIWSELRRRQGDATPSAFLCATDPMFRQALSESLAKFDQPNFTPADLTAFVREAIRPYNKARLCDPMQQNLYPYPA